MNMYRRLSLPDYIIYGLLVVGILYRFLVNPGPLLVPLLVFGVIFLLYKFPPNRLQKHGRPIQSGKRTTERKKYEERERRKAHFRVIPGSKPDSDEEPPKYH
ncbi:MAG: hypothetical protein K0Q90_2867 [Paenibacillaceae bacterium]|jgi:hypothetical protein|nr:hypothetical protein [Paenibacillaceae bacterium]